MPRIGLLSDTHGFLHPALPDILQDCDQIWHAGDIGTVEVLRQLDDLGRPMKAVWGNVDGTDLRFVLPEDQVFEVQGVRVLLSHIVGHPGRLHPRAKPLLAEHDPDLVLYGHSHILRLDYAPDQTLFINPGAMGNSGMHKIRTLMTFELEDQTISDFKILELGNRGQPAEGITKVVEMDEWSIAKAKARK